MCGIAGFHSLDGRRIEKAGALADNLLIQIEPRGRDATGFCAVDPSGAQQIDRYTVTARKFVRARDKFPSDARTVLLHTRYATTGSKHSVRDAHPVVSGNAVAVHNGTIRNADELFTAFSLPRHAKVDSEIIPAMTSFGGWDQVEQSLSLMKGGAATAIVSSDRPGELILARLRSYPLVYCRSKGVIIFASTEQAIRAAWKFTYGSTLKSKVHALAPGEVLRINGKVAKSKVPGVYGIEKDETKFRSTISYPTNGKPRTIHYELPAGSTIADAVPFHACRSEREEQIRLNAIRKGSQFTTSEVLAMIDALEKARQERDEADFIVREMGGDLDWEDQLDLDYSPGKW